MESRMRALVLLTLIGLVALGQLATARQPSLNARRQFRRAEEYARGDRDEKIQAREAELVLSMLNSTSPIPNEIDWRQHPEMVSPVLDQGHCTASFAFAAVGVLEGQQVARGLSKRLQPLSVGQAVHCSIHNGQCYGGHVASALDDIARLGGIETAADFEYHPAGHYCKFDADKVFMKFAGSLTLPTGEAALKAAVGSYGPVAVQIHVNALIYKYKSGVFDEATCDGSDLNQAMLVVGYGTDPNEGDYWILKNSWGTKWGENGYIRMRRGSGMCGLGEISVVARF